AGSCRPPARPPGAAGRRPAAPTPSRPAPIRRPAPRGPPRARPAAAQGWCAGTPPPAPAGRTGATGATTDAVAPKADGGRRPPAPAWLPPVHAPYGQTSSLPYRQDRSDRAAAPGVQPPPYWTLTRN